MMLLATAISSATIEKSKKMLGQMESVLGADSTIILYAKILWSITKNTALIC